MSSRKKSLGEPFSKGDIVSDGDTSGVVVAVATAEATGTTGYLFVDGTGQVQMQTHYGLSGGVRMGRGPAIRDDEGRDLLAGLYGQRSPAAPSEAGPVLDANHDAVNYLDHLAGSVRANGRRGSAVVKAFGAIDASFKREDGPTLGELQRASQAWRELSEEEQRHILNGWRPVAEMPSVRNVLTEALRTAGGETAGRVLTFNFNERETFASPETVFTHGILDAVTVMIRAGATREEAIADLRTALAAVRSQWEKLIDLDDGKSLTVPRVEEVPDAARAEKKPRTASPDSRKPGRRESRKSKAAA